jgi:protein gp37
MRKTKIQWTEATWNPLRGCSRVSQGCVNCYAEAVASRFSGPGQPYERLVDGKGRWNGAIRLVPQKLREPLCWTKPRMVFVNSMSDLFHPAVPDDYIAAVFAVMAACYHHTFQILTKRPQRALEWFRWLEAEARALPFSELSEKADSGCFRGYILHDCWVKAGLPAQRDVRRSRGLREVDADAWPLRNVWLGVSVEDQATAEERIPYLLEAPAAVRWVSYEPALGPVDFTRIPEEELGLQYNALRGVLSSAPLDTGGTTLDWIVVGGESGPGARPFRLDWARQVIRQARGTDCRVFVKQLGARPWDGSPLALSDSKGGEMDEWPEDLRVREWPVQTEADSELPT